MNGGFGECPNCGKLTLVQMVVEEPGPFGGRYIKVKCVNCGFSETLSF